MIKGGYVYILASKRNGTLYIGVTANLAQRHHQHKTGQGSKFAHRNKADKLVYYEQHIASRKPFYAKPK